MSTLIAPGVAFVTGGARGLGNAIALAFAREGCKSIVIVDILPDEAMEEGRVAVQNLGAECLSIRCDVTKEEEVQAAVEKTVTTFGRLDYAANFAGITGPTKNTPEVSVEAFEQCLRVNTVGVWLCTKHQIIQMAKQESLTLDGCRVPQRGAIVNCGSVNSIMSGHTTAAYSASKHGVLGLTKAASLGARQYNIRVNAVSPGFISTPMVTLNIHNNPDPRLRESWEMFESRQGRTAWPEEIGNATVLLCSQKMSLVNAHNLVCDNGFTINENTF